VSTYYCYLCCLVFDPNINQPTEIKKNTFLCEHCALKKESEYQPDEADEWLSIKEGILGATNKK